MVGLSAERQFELRAKKALETGDRSFKPRGAANKAAFAKMKEELGKQTNQINSHTTTEADRIIEETSRRVLETIGQRTQPLPDQITMAAKLSSQSTVVRVLDSILRNGMQRHECGKGSRAGTIGSYTPAGGPAGRARRNKHEGFAIRSSARAKGERPGQDRAASTGQRVRQPL